VLDRDPETLEQALKLTSRLEALRQSELEDKWNDIGRRRDRFVRYSSTEEASWMTALMQQMTLELRENRKQRERLLKTIDGHRHGSESVATTAYESARPTRYSDQPASWYGVGNLAGLAGNFAGSAAEPDTFSGVQPLWLQRLEDRTTVATSSVVVTSE